MREAVNKKSRLSKSDADFKAALRALERAAKRAQETARISNTPVVLWQDGKVKAVRPGTVRRRGRS
jgi:hypothetical protein